ncbi:MAG: 1-phosphofructokinase family hexose kinase [Bacteroidota bacterium]
MKNIITFTINPAIDKNTTVDHLEPEHKLHCTNPIYNPGGGGINVSRAIKRLGGDSLAVFTAGGHTGSFLQEMLTKEDVRQLVIPIAQRTRENFIVVETTTNHQYRFGLGGPSLDESEWQTCLNVLSQLNPDYFVVSGSLSPGVPSDFYAQVARLARKTGARFILDTSGEALTLAVNEGVYLLKPNRAELGRLIGVKALKTEDLEEAARMIISRGYCEVVAISLGEQGALMVAKDQAEHVMAPEAPKRSTVGAGDSMVAGMVWKLSQGSSLSEMVRYGVACGTAATMNTGTELCYIKDVEQLYSQINTLAQRSDANMLIS